MKQRRIFWQFSQSFIGLKFLQKVPFDALYYSPPFLALYLTNLYGPAQSNIYYDEYDSETHLQ